MKIYYLSRINIYYEKRTNNFLFQEIQRVRMPSEEIYMKTDFRECSDNISRKTSTRIKWDHILSIFR